MLNWQEVILKMLQDYDHVVLPNGTSKEDKAFIYFAVGKLLVVQILQ